MGDHRLITERENRGRETLEADQGFNSRLTMQQELPQITLEADPAAYVAGVGALVFTVTRAGDAAAELDLTINITQEQDWLDVTSFAVTIPAGESEQTLALFGDRFSSEVSESGNLTASVAPVDGYDTSDAAVVISVISQDGLAVVVRLDRVEYEVDEGAARWVSLWWLSPIQASPRSPPSSSPYRLWQTRLHHKMTTVTVTTGL